MKRKMTIALIVVLLLVVAMAATFFYVNKVVIPVKLKQILVEKGRELLGRNITIASVDFALLKGFVVRDLTIPEKDAPTPFLRAGKITFRILYLPMFKEKKIVIPSLNVEKSDIVITRRKDNTWNFSDIIQKLSAPKTGKNPFTVFVGNVSLAKTRIEFTDQAITPDFTQTLEDVNLKVRLSLPTGVKFLAEGKAPDATSVVTLRAEGNYDFSKKKLDSRINVSSINLVKYIQAYYPAQNLHIKNAALKSADIALIVLDQKIEAQSKLEFNQLVVGVDPDKEVSGSPLLTLNINYDPGATVKWRYQGSLDPRGATISGLPYVKELKDIAGVIAFEPDKVKTDALSFSTADTKIQLQGTVTDFAKPQADIHASGQIDLTTLKTIFQKVLEGAKIKTMTGQASMSLDYKGLLSVPQEAQLEVTAVVADAALATEQLPVALTGITGKIQYSPNLVNLHNISFLAAGTKIQLSGQVTNLDKPVADIRASSDVDLAILKTIFPDIFEQTKIEELSGHSAVTLEFKGLVASPLQARYRLTAALDGVNLSMKTLPGPLSDVSGTVECAPNNISWEKLKITFNNTVYTTNGTLRDFASPVVETALMSPDFNLKAKINISQKYKAFELASFKGRYFDSDFDLTGNISLTENNEPHFDLTGTLGVDLKNLSQIPGIPADTIKNLKPAGPVSIKGSVKNSGAVKDWPKWQILLNATGPEIMLSGYRLKDASLTFSQDPQQQGGRLEISSSFYEGPLKIVARTNSLQEETPYTLTVNLENADLAKLKNDIAAWRDKDITGFLSANLSAQGLLSQPRGIEGQGSILIKDGHLWELDLFKGLGKFLLIPEFEHITFKEAKGDFTIENERLSTSNFELGSDAVTLMCAGYVDFNTNLNFDIAAQFSEETIAQSSSLKKMATAILTQSGDYIAFKLTGTLQNPKYTIAPSSLNIFKKTKDLLQGIFQ